MDSYAHGQGMLFLIVFSALALKVVQVLIVYEDKLLPGDSHFCFGVQSHKRA